jgi:hypothetical protein
MLTEDRFAGKNEPGRSAPGQIGSDKVGVREHRSRQVALRQVAIPHGMTRQIDPTEIDAVRIR